MVFLRGMDASDTYAVDQVMLRKDGTADKSVLGANAIFGGFYCNGKSSRTIVKDTTLPFRGWRYPVQNCLCR